MMSPTDPEPSPSGTRKRKLGRMVTFEGEKNPEPRRMAMVNLKMSAPLNRG